MTVTGWLSCCWRSTGFGWFAPGVLGGPEHRQRREHRRASESREIVSFVSFVSSVSRIMFLHVSDLWFWWWLVNVHFHWRRCICKNYTCNLTAVFFWTSTFLHVDSVWNIMELLWEQRTGRWVRTLGVPGSDWQPSFIERSERSELFKLLQLRTDRNW